MHKFIYINHFQISNMWENRIFSIQANKLYLPGQSILCLAITFWNFIFFLQLNHQSSAFDNILRKSYLRNRKNMVPALWSNFFSQILSKSIKMIYVKILTIWSSIDEANLPNDNFNSTVCMKNLSFALVRQTMRPFVKIICTAWPNEFCLLH